MACRTTFWITLTLGLLPNLTFGIPLMIGQKEIQEAVDFNNQLHEPCTFNRHFSKSDHLFSPEGSPGVDMVNQNHILSENEYSQHGKVMLTDFHEASVQMDRIRKAVSCSEPFGKRVKIGIPMDSSDEFWQNAEEVAYDAQELGIDAFDIPVVEDLNELFNTPIPPTYQRVTSAHAEASPNPIGTSIKNKCSFKSVCQLSEAELEIPGELEYTPFTIPLQPSIASVRSGPVKPNEILVDFSYTSNFAPQCHIEKMRTPLKLKNLQVENRFNVETDIFNSNTKGVDVLSLDPSGLLQKFVSPPQIIEFGTDQIATRNKITANPRETEERYIKSPKDMVLSFRDNPTTERLAISDQKVSTCMCLPPENMKTHEELYRKKNDDQAPLKGFEMTTSEPSHELNSRVTVEPQFSPEILKFIHENTGYKAPQSHNDVKQRHNLVDPPSSITIKDSITVINKTMSSTQVHVAWIMAYELRWKIILKLSSYASGSVSLIKTHELFPFTFKLVENMPSFIQWNTIIKIYVKFLARALTPRKDMPNHILDSNRISEFQKSLMWISEIIFNVSDWPFYTYVLTELTKHKNDTNSKRFCKKKHSTCSILVQVFSCEANPKLLGVLSDRATDKLYNEWITDFMHGFPRPHCENPSSSIWAGNMKRDWQTWVGVACSIEEFYSIQLLSVPEQILKAKGIHPSMGEFPGSFMKKSDFEFFLEPHMQMKESEFFSENASSKYYKRFKNIFESKSPEKKTGNYFPDRMREIFDTNGN